MHEISDMTRLRRNPNMVFSVIDEEVVMLSVDNGEYYNLNEVSSEIWHKLNDSCTFKDLIGHLRKKFEVEQEICENETKFFLEQVLIKGIIEIIHE